MISILALTVVGLDIQGDPKQTVTLGNYSIGGHDVPAVVPAAEGPIGPNDKVVVLDGEKYLVDPSGRFIRHFRANGGWSEVREGFAIAKAAQTPQTPEWRIKAFVLPRNDILDLAPNGIARVRRSTMETAEIAHVVESLSRFAAMAESSGQGKMRLKVDLEIDHDTAFQTASTNSTPFGSEFLTQYLRPRINGGLYEAEDRVYRGPYDSIFVIHGGFSGLAPMVSVSGTAVSPIAFYAQGRPLGMNALSIALFNEWTRHLAFAAFKSGYRFSGSESSVASTTAAEQAQGFGPEVGDPAGAFKGGMWGSVLGKEESATDAFLRHFGSASSDSKAWAEVADDPFAKVPYVTLDQLGQKTGIRGLAVSGAYPIRFTFEGIGERPATIGVDTRLDPGSEASAVVVYQEGKRQLTFVDSPFAELFGRGIPASADPKVMGWTSAGGRPLFVFDSLSIARGQSEAAMLELPGFKFDSIVASVVAAAPSQEEVGAELVPDGKTALTVSATGGIVVTDAQDSERGEVLSLRTSGLVRTGSALLLGARNGPTVFDARTHPYLSFFVKPEKPEPMRLVLVPADGLPEKALRLFGSWPTPSELSAVAIPEIVLPAGAGWKQVIVDLRKLNIGPVAAVLLSSNEHVGYWPAKQAVAPLVLLDDLKVSKTAPGAEIEPTPTSEISPDATSANSEARALFAVRAGADAADVTALITLLKDQDDMVRLNAARAFSRVKNLAAEAPLSDLVRSLDPRIAEAALDALAFQDTPTGWATIKRAIEVGPFDLTRVFAVRAYGRKMDTKSLATLSLMLTSKSWRGRAYAAEAIGALPSQPQPLVLMTFLVETDPGVRLAATKGALMTDDEVCKRILWSAVNDPSDELRAWSCLRLIESGNPKYVNEGLKGVRDESPGMRKRLLVLLREKPMEAARPALRLAVADALPSVRAEALLSFAKIPGPVKAEEVENTLSDPDPRVKAALAELKAAKGF